MAITCMKRKGVIGRDYHLKQIQGELLRLINFEHIIGEPIQVDFHIA
jgi:hypothetical protein